eukprot:scaffold5525_cov120-Skeletonema_marinoi.AAC.4
MKLCMSRFERGEGGGLAEGARGRRDGAVTFSYSMYGCLLTTPANFSGAIQRYSGHLLKAASTECASALEES